MDGTDDSDRDEYLPAILEHFGWEGSHCWRIHIFLSHLLLFKVSYCTSPLNSQHIFQPSPYNDTKFILAQPACWKYFQHYENLKHLIFAKITTHRVRKKDRQVKAVYLINYPLLPTKTDSSHFHRCKLAWNFYHFNTH